METSAPLAEDETPSPTSPATPDEVTAAPTTFSTTAASASPATQATPRPTVQRNVCPGVCVGKGLSQYCQRALTGPSCGPDAVCCTSSESATQAEQPSHQHHEPPPREQRPPAEVQEGSNQEASLPECPGSCVSPLLSILCDQVSTAHSCRGGGSCCISAAAATTTEAPPPPCGGRCLPPFLSGVCQKPAQLVLRTSTCPSGTICCSQHGPDNRPGFFAPGPMRRPAPPQQQRPPMPPERQEYHNGPQGHDQLNAVIPIEQEGGPAFGHRDPGHGRPPHEHRPPPQQTTGPDYPPRDVTQQGFQGGPRPDKLSTGLHKRPPRPPQPVQHGGISPAGEVNDCNFFPHFQHMRMFRNVGTIIPDVGVVDGTPAWLRNFLFPEGSAFISR